MSMNRRDYVSEYEACPECGMSTFYHDEDTNRHICMRKECGYVEDDEESIWLKLLRLLRIKKK